MRKATKTIVIVMDEKMYNEQMKQMYELRKTSIQVYDGDIMESIERSHKNKYQ